MRVLVAGGAGFLGPHLYKRLLKRSDTVVSLSGLSTGRQSNLATFDPKLGFLYEDRGADKQVKVRTDALAHLPSSASTPGCMLPLETQAVINHPQCEQYWGNGGFVAPRSSDGWAHRSTWGTD